MPWWGYFGEQPTQALANRGDSSGTAHPIVIYLPHPTRTLTNTGPNSPEVSPGLCRVPVMANPCWQRDVTLELHLEAICVWHLRAAVPDGSISKHISLPFISS